MSEITPLPPVSAAPIPPRRNSEPKTDLYIPRSPVGSSPLVIPPVMNSDNPKWDNVSGFIASRIGFINNCPRELSTNFSKENLEELNEHLRAENDLIPLVGMVIGGNASDRVSLYMSYVQGSYGASAHDFSASYKEVGFGFAVGLPLGDSYIGYTGARCSLEFNSNIPTIYGANSGVVLDQSHYVTARTRVTPWLALGTTFKAPQSKSAKGELIGTAEIGYFPFLNGTPIGLGISASRNKFGADLDIYRVFNAGVETDGKTSTIRMTLSLGVGLRKS